MAYKHRSENKRVITLGPIIHNKQVVSKLESDGIVACNSLEAALASVDGDAIVLIRTHGAVKGMVEKVRGMGVKIYDATCPFVIRSHKIVENISEEGYFIVIFGDSKHPEVVGIMSYANEGSIHVVSNPEDVRRIQRRRRMSVLAQTTQDMKKFKEVISELLDRTFELRVFNTICPIILEAQEEARKISTIVDTMVVVGGRMSSNTDKLWKVCKSVNDFSYKVESLHDLDPAWFNKAKSVGVTAGTSTAGWIIDEVIKGIGECAGREILVENWKGET
jgi:4-hydroxy-3-methylbut-2-enyl diphosphate reductase